MFLNKAHQSADVYLNALPRSVLTVYRMPERLSMCIVSTSMSSLCTTPLFAEFSINLFKLYFFSTAPSISSFPDGPVLQQKQDLDQFILIFPACLTYFAETSLTRSKALCRNNERRKQYVAARCCTRVNAIKNDHCAVHLHFTVDAVGEGGGGQVSRYSMKNISVWFTFVMREVPRQGMSWMYLSTEWVHGGEIDIDCLRCVRISQETSVFPPKNQLFRLVRQMLKCKLFF